mmetsp:Transcript_63829/g.94813  ORF Transcript_63829/g.94813 Transcript_63829/m.94813 type:complete len:218 (-) Transcript_63829:61-714(-)
MSLTHHDNDTVTDLLIHRRGRARKPHVLNDVNEGISQPADGCEVPSSRHQPRHRLRLLRCGCPQAHQQREHHIRERDHGQSPPEPPHSQVLLDLSRVPQGHHHRARHTQLGAQSSSLTCRQLHHQNQFDEQQGHGEQPINVPVGVVERRTGHLHGIGPADLIHIECLNPRVEDTEVMVRGNPGDDPGDGESSSIILADIAQLQPKEHRRGAHGSNPE